MLVTHVVHAVTNVQSAAELLCDALDFERREVTHTAAVLDNGAISLGLDQDHADGKLRLSSEVRDMEGALHRLEQDFSGFVVSRMDDRMPEVAQVLVALPFGVEVCLQRLYDEDELGTLPVLPANLAWTADADLAVRELLRIVPLVFRDLARQRVTDRIEKKTVADGSVEVSIQCALFGMVEATPTFQHARLREAFAERGEDVSRYPFDPDPGT